MVYIYNGKLFSLKRKEILSHATTRMNLEDIMLIEINQSRKDKYCTTIYGASKSSQIRKNRKCLPRAGGKGEWRVVV